MSATMGDTRRQRGLLERYASAVENADRGALLRLLREDAVLQLPPSPAWFAGRDQIGRFLATGFLGQPGDFALVQLAANGQPGFALYRRDRDGRYHAHAVQVLTLDAAFIAGVVSFQQPRLFGLFSLPADLPPGAPRAGLGADREAEAVDDQRAVDQGGQHRPNG